MNPEEIAPSVQTSEPLTVSEDRYQKDGFTLRRKRLNDGRWGKWTVRIRFKGKIHPLTLSETAKESLEQAKRAKREIHAGRWEDLKNTVALRKHTVITLGELEKAYLAAPVEASATTRKQNWNALEQLITVADGGASVPASRSSSCINATLAQSWFKAAQDKIDAEPDQAKQATLKRSANSRFTQAASIFTPRAMASYKLNNQHHEGFDKFLAAGELYQFVRIPKQQYLPPSESIIKTTLDAWQALTDRDLFLALGHELAFGLRAGEIVQVKWKWWSEREGYPVLDGTGEFKNGSGHISVRALDPWFSIMRERIVTKAWRGKDDEFVITGLDTQRSDLVYRAASAWLRAQGWQTQKTNHALRAYAGSQVAMRYGIYDAQTWLRHASVVVTEQHYSYFVKTFKPADVTTLPARWATVTHEFKPVILPAANQ